MFSVAYRPPTIIEEGIFQEATTTLPLPPPFNTVVTPVRGSHNLGPEQIISGEIGYQGWYLRHRLRIRANLFFNHLSDLIEFGSTPDIAQNQGHADIYGGEVGVEALLASWLNGFANYSYEEIGHQTFTGSRQRGAPRNKVNVGLRGEWENGLTGEVRFHYVDAVTYPVSSSFAAFVPFGVVPPSPQVGSYSLLNLRAGYQFWRDKAEVAVSAFNALNDKHRENSQGEVIGSRVMGWLTVRF